MTSASAVATSCRPRRPREPIPSAPSTENTARPMSVLMPSRLAPAAPANAPLGMAWAGNAEPRSTTKYPTTPATTATIVAVVQAFIMKPGANMLSPSSLVPGVAHAVSPARSRRIPRGDLVALGGERRSRLPVPGSGPGGRQAGGQVGDEDDGHDEEADRQAEGAGSPGITVVSQPDSNAT